MAPEYRHAPLRVNKILRKVFGGVKWKYENLRDLPLLDECCLLRRFGTIPAYSGFYANTGFSAILKRLLLLDAGCQRWQSKRVKEKLPEEILKKFAAWGKKGGNAGDPEKKRASAFQRWAKVKASKPASK